MDLDDIGVKLDYTNSKLDSIESLLGGGTFGGGGSGGGGGAGGSGGGGGGSATGTASNGQSFLNLINNLNQALNQTKAQLQGIYQNVKHMVEPWAEVDNAASKYAKTIAMTEAGMKRLRKATIDNVVNAKIGINYNVSPEELIQYQQKYVQSVGRALRIDNTQQESLAAMHAVMDGRETELAAAFENFGVSLNGVADHAGKMFSDASKQGLSFEKYSDNVAKNIKIAQNYTFKNGLKGLESMAKKATALKLDMGQVASFADKVSTIEGAIDVASKLQVLGGSFAGIADPLGMLNEGLMDMEGLTDRVIKMIGGMGAFNRQTGEVEVSAFNKQRIKAAAQAMGMDYSQLMESVNASAKREEITRQISASANATGLNNDMKELIKNSATFNEEGKAGVSINGQFKTLDELSDEDYDDLVKETQDQAADIKDIARTLRSFKDMEEGTKKQYRAVKAQHAEKLGVGEGLKQLIGWAGKQTWLLRIIAAGSWAKSIMGVIGNVGSLIGGWKNILGGKNWFGKKSIFGNRIGGAAGRFGNGIGSNARMFGTYGNKTGQMFKGTKFGNFMRRGGARMYKVGAKMDAVEAKVLGGIRGKAGEIGGKVTGKFGNKISGKLGSSSLKELGGRLGANSITNVSKLGTKLSEKGFTKVGTALTEHASKQAVEHGMKNVAKMGGKKIAAKTATKIGTKMAAGVAKGGVLGIVGAAGNIATDMLVDSGKIKKGGAAHTAMKVGSTALEGAALGATIGSVFPGIGTAIGTAVGAIGGAVVGAFKMAKIKREKRVDDKLERMGIERKGNYGARSYKLINRALETGEISDRMRRKLEKKGDHAMLEAIDKKKAEKDEKKRKDRNERLAAIFGGRAGKIAKGTFNVTQAYFNGDAFGANIERKGQYDDDENKAIDEALKTGELADDLRQKLSENGDEEIIKAIEKRKENPNGGNNGMFGMMAQKNKFGVANFEIGVANFTKFGRFGMSREERVKEKLKKAKLNMKAGFGATELAAGMLTFNPFAIWGGIKKLRDFNKAKKAEKENEENGISNIKGLPESGISKELEGLNKSIESAEKAKAESEKNQPVTPQEPFNGGKIDLNISGTIKLEGANGKQVDITKDLLRDGNFIREITKLITERIGEHQKGSNRQDNNNMARVI